MPPRTLLVRGYAACDVLRFTAGTLESIYRSADVTQFDNFLRIWNSCSQQDVLLNTETVPVFLVDAYEIFQDFYNPTNLGRIVDPKKVQSIQNMYHDIPYLLIQENLTIAQRASLEKDDLGRYTAPAHYIFTIQRFYPRLDIPGKTPLYLAAYSREYLMQFLDGELCAVDNESEKNSATAKTNSCNRLKFLNQFFRILRGHWTGWHVETHPYVSSINFTSDYQEAIVDFRIGYEGGDARYTKRNGTWELLESGLFWME